MTFRSETLFVKLLGLEDIQTRRQRTSPDIERTSEYVTSCHYQIYFLLYIGKQGDAQLLIL